MNKLIAGIGALVVLAAVSAGSLFLGSKTQAVNPAPVFTTGGFNGAVQQAPTKTAEQVIAEEVRQAPDGLERTFVVYSGITAKNGAITILNNAPYNSTANVSTVVPSSILPPGATVETLKGHTVKVSKGRMDSYKGKPQILATTLEVVK